MSEMQTETTTKETPQYELGSVNVQSLKEIISEMATTHPFPDETTKVAFFARVDSLDKAGDPTAPENEAAEDQANVAKIADLEAQIAALEAEKAAASGTQTTPPEGA